MSSPTEKIKIRKWVSATLPQMIGLLLLIVICCAVAAMNYMSYRYGSPSTQFLIPPTFGAAVASALVTGSSFRPCQEVYRLYGSAGLGLCLVSIVLLALPHAQ